jgi:hypothetical protein
MLANAFCLEGEKRFSAMALPYGLPFLDMGRLSQLPPLSAADL